MIIKTYLPVLFLLLSNINIMTAQTFTGPAVGLKKPQTLEVLGVELNGEKTVIRLSVENKIKGGTFCADRNIFIITPDGLRIRLEKASGIPQCPAVHKFKKEGEILEFSLIFPALDPVPGWIDLVEECGDNCFSAYGILLNDEFSRRIDEAFIYAGKGQTDSAIGLYRKLIGDAGAREAGIAGSLYCDLISLMASKGYKASAAEWYRKLASSDLPGKQMYLDNLNFHGIRY